MPSKNKQRCVQSKCGWIVKILVFTKKKNKNKIKIKIDRLDILRTFEFIYQIKIDRLDTLHTLSLNFNTFLTWSSNHVQSIQFVTENSIYDKNNL